MVSSLCNLALGNTYSKFHFLLETVWEKPKCGYLTLAEYDGVMEQAKRAQECKEEAERKFMVRDSSL